ncbi:histidine-type phosphatase [Phytoactinopolyspora limicola]|uniref:histidine-type phosphatase n=1 Tax=Phytoactinopolyspora limicola TaxID=2715536 RepID=UPI00140C10EF|nr:histidine-type phosphatase [Phytoactinopolyspora limicola]
MGSTTTRSPGEVRRRTTASVIAAAAAVALILTGAGVANGQAPAVGEPQGHYSTKKPYEPQGQPGDYTDAPDGFEPVSVQHVARHGSRLLSSKKYDDLTLQLWEAARDEQALTPIGARLGGEVRRLIRVHERLGYGNLSELGAREHEDMAMRVHERLPELFDHALEDGQRIGVVTSGKDRAVDSADNFVDGLVMAEPGLAGLIDTPVVDEDVLYFHNSERNADYRDYKDNDPRLLAALAEVADDPQVHAAARRMMERLFDRDFVDRLDAGEFEFVDRGKGETVLDDVASAADYLYNLYIIAPGIPDEGRWRFDQYVTAEDAEMMAYFVDTQQFYEKGPAFEGDDITYRMAQVLLDDLFAEIDAVRAGASEHAAVFRFAHAEQIMPLAALMQLPGAGVEQPEGELFSYENNPWRGDQVSPMGANVQWDVYANADGDYLVRMLVNEAETPFKEECQPYSDGGLFYELDELKDCLAG